MTKLKKTFVYASIVLGITFLIAVILLIVNSNFPKCDDGKYSKDDEYCFFISNTTTCPQDTDSIFMKNQTAINQTEETILVCTYEPERLVNNKIVWVIFGVFFGIWFIVLLIFLFSLGQKGSKKVDIGQFRKEDFVNANRARYLWALSHARENGIPLNGDKFDESKFNFFGKQNVFQKGQEWFVKFQSEVTDGINPGLYTVIISLSRGEEWILGGMQNWHECHYDSYKFNRMMPIHTPDNPQERMMQQMWETNPEKAMELQRRVLEEGIVKGQQAASLPTQDNLTDTDAASQLPTRPAPYRRYYGYRKPWYRR